MLFSYHIRLGLVARAIWEVRKVEQFPRNKHSERQDMTKKEAIYAIDGKVAKLSDVNILARDITLKEALGDYISASDVRETCNKVGIKDATLRNWRNSGKIRAKKVGGTWFYSRQDLVELIKTSDG